MAQIAIIDDDPLQLTMFKAMLVSPQFTIVTYLSAEEALNGMAEDIPDIILLDLALPGMHGYDCIQYLRQNELLAHIPVIAISAQLSSNTHIKCQTLGFKDLIAKPIGSQQLRAKVNYWLNSNQKA